MPTPLQQFRSNFDLDRIRRVTFLTTDHKKLTCLGHIGRR
jgi:hypothetical protein